MPQQKPTNDSSLYLYVRRGDLRRFHRLKRDAADLPVSVVWDRRTDDRRTSPKPTTAGARKAERRREPPFTWKAASFVVVNPAEKNPGPKMAAAIKRPNRRRSK
jgi:hypothetical protein